MRPLCSPEEVTLAAVRSCTGAAMVAVVLMSLVSGVTARADDAPKAPEPAASPSSTDAAPATSPGETPDKTAPADAKRKWIRGDFDIGFNAAWSSDASDFDLNQYLRLKVDPPQCEQLHIRGAVWLNENLGSNVPDYSVLRDINDGWNSDFRVRPLYLYADIDNVWCDSVLRVGRQRIIEGAAFNRIDGVYFKQHLGIWDWYVFAGTRATLYDDAFRDPVAGGGASVRLGDRTRVALDAYYGQENRDKADERAHGGLSRAHTDNTAVSLSVWQTVTPNLSLYGRLDLHEGNGDEILLNATGVIPAWDLTYEVAYHRQLNTLSDRVNDLTGFYAILGNYNTHDNYFAALHKTLTKHFAISLEGEIHRANGSDWMTGNEDYERFSLVLAAEKICKTIDAQAALERWSVDGGEGTWAVTGEATKHWNKIDLTVGADYERYEDRLVNYTSTPYILDQLRVLLLPGQYQTYNPLVYLFDTYALQLHEDIYSFYCKMKWSFAENQQVTAGLTYEEDDSPESPYWRLKAQYSIRF